MEMLVIVVVIGILAAIGTVGYGRYIGRARTSEASTMIAEIAAREEVYYTEFAQYLPARDLGGPMPAPVAAAATGVDDATAAPQFFPQNPAGMGASARTSASSANPPESWAALGVRVRDGVLYCTYFGDAGVRGSIAGGTFGQAMLGTGVTLAPWYYILGSCNLNGAAGYPAAVTTMGMASDEPSLTTFNDGQ